MKTWRLITDDGASASGGLATDESLMRRYATGDPPPPTLRLYTYADHAALVGRFQDPRAELRLDVCRAEGIAVNRRPTGGGAILMGEQQLGVALVTSLRDPNTPAHARAIIDTFGRGVLLGLKRLGIPAEIRGKNDIAVDGRKIAGLGIYVDANDGVLFHASVLAGLDIDLMLRILNIPAAKLGGQAADAVRQRITTVTAERGRACSTEDLRLCVEAGFEDAFGIRVRPEPLDPAELAAARDVEAQRYGRDDWIYGRAAETPEGTAILKTPGGLLRIALTLGGDAIKDALIAGDFMARERAVAEIEAALKWAAADKGRVGEAVETGWSRGGGLDGVAPGDLTEAVWAAVIDARARRGMTTGSCYYPPAPDEGSGDPTTSTREEAPAWQ